jgi:TRAP transporter TAXI family solute receptor
MDRFGPSLRLLLSALAGIAALALLGFGISMILRPTVLRLAVGPGQSEIAKIGPAMAQILVREEAGVRIKTVPVSGFEEAAKLLDTGRADAAILRSDVPVPDDARTVAILSRNAAIFIAPATSGIIDIPDLFDRTVGVLRLGPSNERLLDTVLAFYGMAADRVRRVGLQPDEIAEALRDGRIEALLVIGPPTGTLVTKAVQDVARATGAPPTFLPFREAAAFAQKNEAFEPLEIPRGTYGATPPLPGLPLPVVAVTFRLVVDADLGTPAVTELTRSIFENRRDLAEAVPVAAGLEAPDTGIAARHRVHPGSAIYLDGEEPGFIEKYIDWIYLGAMAAGLLASGGAALWSRRRSRVDAAEHRFERLTELLQAARAAPDRAALDAIEAETDVVLFEVMRRAVEEDAETGRLIAARLGLDHVRAAILERRALLAR